MKQPRKPGWKKWVTVFAAVTILGGAGILADTFPPPSLSLNISSAFKTAAKPQNKLQDKLQDKLIDAAQFNDVEEARAAINLGADIRSQNDLVLRVASSWGSPAVAEYALDHGANINVNAGEPLENAAAGGNFSTVKLLVERGADITINHNAALWWATARGHHAMASYLLEKGAKPDEGMLGLASLNQDSLTQHLLREALTQSPPKQNLNNISDYLGPGF